MGHIRGKVDPPLNANQLPREQKQEQDAKHGSGIILICPNWLDQIQLASITSLWEALTKQT